MNPYFERLFWDRVNFSVKRWIRHNPTRTHLGWLKTSIDLREPTPIPLALDPHLKPGYYWADLIH